MILQAEFLKVVIITAFCPLIRKKKTAKRRKSKKKFFTGCQK